jgi:hypothetical protein
VIGDERGSVQRIVLVMRDLTLAIGVGEHIAFAVVGPALGFGERVGSGVFPVAQVIAVFRVTAVGIDDIGQVAVAVVGGKEIEPDPLLVVQPVASFSRPVY